MIVKGLAADSPRRVPQACLKECSITHPEVFKVRRNPLWKWSSELPGIKLHGLRLSRMSHLEGVNVALGEGVQGPIRQLLLVCQVHAGLS